MKRLSLCVVTALFAMSVFFSCAGLDSSAEPAAGAPEGGLVADKPKTEAESGMPETPAVARESTASKDDEKRMEAPSLRGAEAAVSPAPFYEEAPGKALSGTSAAASPRAVPGASGLKAGYSDDNAQFGYFIDFLKKFNEVEHYAYDISERITIRVLDSTGKPAANARVTIQADGATLAVGSTNSDGSYRFYPSALGTQASFFEFRTESRTESGMLSARLSTRRDGPRLVELKLQGPRLVPEPLPLDVLFVMDTTGSMGEEIQRLKSTIEIIYANLAELKPQPLVRFGLVLYKDRGDEYITEVTPFTADLDVFQARLDPVEASGGGDGPEDLESALDDAVNTMDWNTDGLRLAFVVTDAEAHLDYNRDYTYIKAATDARSGAIKLYTIGTGGLPIEGEYLLRQISQLTDARYIFLTYGEGGEAEGGAEGSVSHHTGANFQTDKLEAIIIRFVKEEAANFSDTPLTAEEDFFDARKVPDESRDETLGKLFADAVDNLADYSTFHINADTPCVILPVTSADVNLGAAAEYFGERLSLAASGAKRWKPVERKDMQKILAELELQLSGLVDEGNAARVGKVLGADVLVASTLYRRANQYELFLRLVRVSTAEVLAVSRAKIALDLGL